MGGGTEGGAVGGDAGAGGGEGGGYERPIVEFIASSVSNGSMSRCDCGAHESAVRAVRISREREREKKKNTESVSPSSL